MTPMRKVSQQLPVFYSGLRIAKLHLDYSSGQLGQSCSLLYPKRPDYIERRLQIQSLPNKRYIDGQGFTFIY